MNRVNQVLREHFGPVSHDFRRGMTADMISDLGELAMVKKKIEELAAEIIADQERIDEERAGRRASHEIEDWSGLSKKGRIQRNEPEK